MFHGSVAPKTGGSTNVLSPWLARIERIGEAEGAFEILDDNHYVLFVGSKSRVLLVSFETAQRVRRDAPDSLPLGLSMARPWGWSQLSVISNGETWFRSEAVFDYFDRLASDGFFDDFDRIIYYGSGPSTAYAAAALSLAAPGSVVVAVAPQATLDPRRAGWDDRFPDMRRTHFTGRYGYAPDMLDGAHNAFVLYDPENRLDSIHASLFHAEHITHVPMRGLGGEIEQHLLAMGLLSRILAMAASGNLTSTGLAKLYRKRRNYVPWLDALAKRLAHRNRPWLTAIACRSILRRQPSTRLERLYDESVAQLRRTGRDLPSGRAKRRG